MDRFRDGLEVHYLNSRTARFGSKPSISTYISTYIDLKPKYGTKMVTTIFTLKACPKLFVLDAFTRKEKL